MKPIPTPQIVPLSPVVTPLSSTPSPSRASASRVLSLRDDAIAEFLQAKNLALKSEKAYRLDLNRFTRWCDSPGSPYQQQPWREVTARQLRHFKTYLQQDLQLSAGTIRRTLSTLKQFFDWLQDNEFIQSHPARTLELPEAPEPTAKDLSTQEVEWLYRAATLSKLPERNTAIVSVLLHGLRAEEICNLNVADFDGVRLHIHKAKRGSIGTVPLKPQAQQHLLRYLEWRQAHTEGNRAAGTEIASDCPLFISYSPRNRHQRLGYDGLYKLVSKELQAIAQQIAQAEGKEVSHLHPHRGRHTFATSLVVDGMRYKTMDSRLAMKLTRHRSAHSFERYVKRADELLAEAAFFETEALKQAERDT